MQKRRKILAIVGARPNFIKITQFERAFGAYPEEFEYRLLHTGQHFDENMSKVFFEQLRLTKPHYHLKVRDMSPATQIGKIIMALEEVLQDYEPDLMIVVGDVNSTLAAAIAANKTGTKLAHVESGLRSYDRTMPEEVNRVLTDEIADFLFVTEQIGVEHLLEEGKDPAKIFLTGNNMIDTLVAFDAEIQKQTVLEDFGLQSKEYVLVTMHRPVNVDTEEQLQKLVAILTFIADKWKLVFPIHPRTLRKLKEYHLLETVENHPNIVNTPALDFLSFQKLIQHAYFMLTDSGGVQQETTFREVPCLTLRDTTELLSTIEMGTNELISFDMDLIKEKIAAIEAGTFKPNSCVPPMWDGKATDRMVEVIRDYFSK